MSKIIGSVKPPEDTMSERDTMNAFIDGSKKASYAAKELALACQSPEWANVVSTLEALCDGAQKLANMKAMSRLETLMAANMKTAHYLPN